MSNLFAFTQAQETAVSFVPDGHYDAKQQLWIANETSYAVEEDLAATREATVKVTGTPQGSDWEAGVKLDF